ncbi:LINE-1 retrotransposable element ORF2 protein [Vitis vinifera]|uniref:LINE-1 retrotransposable element ORF2 protein n=1 Tax=Vitis vinifera TaxID=29760 RepID=A0A438IXG2_VITVI|nr:LINE-1 retrotransposable element ORF2 protein [Vitis vinifera]
MWLQHPNFKENFRDWWSGFQGNGWEGHKFMRRLQYEGGLNSDLFSQRASRKGELEELILREEIHWRQKAKELENERGLVLKNAESIIEEILHYFEKLYTSPTGESWGVEGLDWSPISEESALRLDSPFTEEEISKTIFQLDRDKAPGPDGFTIAVFQECWDVIKEELVRVFAEFHRSRIINQSTNASFIVLLPKKSLSKRISDFRPISLITSLYKIIAKVLSGRLRGVLHETIHYTQGAFVQGRQILDAVLIANEIVDERRRSGEEGVIFKIDFEKAYDHVKWDFLDHVLEKKGAKGWVKASRGLRQGDPLSPFLFTLVADVLSRMLMRAEERNMMEGFRVGRNRTRVSHLQFADDTIFFSNSREEELQTLKSLLLVFGHISGLKVNLDKSSIYGINLDQAHLSRLAVMLDCKASGWPILYLGLPLGENRKACGFWDPMIERISSRLDGWQKTYLSFGGRITLTQSCLTHLPCYFLSLFKIPASVAAKIKRLQRDFLWSGVGEGKRDHLVRYPREGSALWHQVILSIYGSHSNGWDAYTLVRWSHRCPWKAIAQVFQGFLVYSVCGRKRGKNSVLGPSRPFSWNLNFRRNLSDSEIEDLEGLMRSLDDLYLSPSDFSSKFVWNSQVPFKVKSFVWLVAHKKVNTNDMLQVRRPYKALSPDICILCMKHGESADHLFLHCSLTIGLWHRLFQLAKMDWVPPRSIYDMMSIKFRGFDNSKRGIVLWQAASIALIRVVWWERNARIFEDKARNSEFLWDSIVFLASFWAFCSKAFKGTPLNVIQLDWITVCTP